MNDFQEYIHLLNEKERLEMRDKGLSPKEILDFLNYKEIPEDYIIVLDNENYPDYFHSYRGNYCELALSYQNDEKKTVGEFKKELEDVNGKIFTGWKGGDFKMSWHDSIHIVSSEGIISDDMIGNIILDNKNKKVVLEIIKIED